VTFEDRPESLKGIDEKEEEERPVEELTCINCKAKFVKNIKMTP
jgi:hypothetical protein